MSAPVVIIELVRSLPSCDFHLSLEPLPCDEGTERSFLLTASHQNPLSIRQAGRNKTGRLGQFPSALFSREPPHEKEDNILTLRLLGSTGQVFFRRDPIPDNDAPVRRNTESAIPVYPALAPAEQDVRNRKEEAMQFSQFGCLH